MGYMQAFSFYTSQPHAQLFPLYLHALLAATLSHRPCAFPFGGINRMGEKRSVFLLWQLLLVADERRH